MKGLAKLAISVALAGVLVTSTGCPLADKYLELVSGYKALRESVKVRCADGTISADRCDWLAQRDLELRALDRLVKQGDAARKQIKAAVEELELAIEEERLALEDAGG